MSDVKATPTEAGAYLPPEIVAFLMGEAPYDGVWFGELNEGLPGAFWWRAIIAAARRETADQVEQARLQGWNECREAAAKRADYYRALAVDNIAGGYRLTYNKGSEETARRILFDLECLTPSTPESL
jgi:hypothetical protein